MNRITFIEIGGKSFPLSFSLGMLKDISRKFGSFNKIEDVMSKIDEEMTEESIDVISFLVYILIKQGALYCNTFGNGQPLPDNIAKDENGKILALTQEQVEVGLSMEGIEDAMKCISEAMTGSSQTEIEVQSDSKNEEATHQV